MPSAAQADAVLRGSATIWTTGYISPSPRSKGAEEATYQGYASAELNGKSGKTLWSYLVTPRKPGWKSISDDLGDQLAASLMEAVGKKDSGAAASSRHIGGWLGERGYVARSGRYVSSADLSEVV